MGQNIEQAYLILLNDILQRGVEKSDRTGTGTISVFGRQIRHDMKTGFPLLTTKKMYWKGIVTELIWFLRGHTNIKFLVDNDCHIWDGDAYQAYLNKWSYETYPNDGRVVNIDPIEVKPHTKEQFIYRIKTDDEFAKKWGSLGKIYGAQWRNWEVEKHVVHPNNDILATKHIDQITNLINDLKTNPDSRRLIVSAWNTSDLDSMVLPPCHYGFQVYTRELSLEERLNLASKKYSVFDPFDFNEVNHEEIDRLYPVPKRAISLMYNARSQDVPLGTPFNIASYALLLEIIGRMVNMVPDELITNMGDCHIYKNQVDGVMEQLTRETYPLPKLVISDGVNFTGTIDEFLNSCSISDFKIEGYQSHPTIKMPLSN